MPPRLQAARRPPKSRRSRRVWHRWKHCSQARCPCPAPMALLPPRQQPPPIGTPTDPAAAPVWRNSTSRACRPARTVPPVTSRATDPHPCKARLINPRHHPMGRPRTLTTVIKTMTRPHPALAPLIARSRLAIVSGPTICRCLERRWTATPKMLPQYSSASQWTGHPKYDGTMRARTAPHSKLLLAVHRELPTISPRVKSLSAVCSRRRRQRHVVRPLLIALRDACKRTRRSV